MISSADRAAMATPRAGFVVKLTTQGSRHYINICGHPSVGSPIDPMDREVSEERLRLCGIDNTKP